MKNTKENLIVSHAQLALGVWEISSAREAVNPSLGAWPQPARLRNTRAIALPPAHVLSLLCVRANLKEKEPYGWYSSWTGQ